MRIFCIILGLNLMIALLYFIIHMVRKKRNRVEFVAKTIVMLLCPIAGPLFVLVGTLIYRYIFQKDVDLEDVIFQKDRVKIYLRADEERGRTMVPLEEALVVTDKNNLRNLMLNVVRGETRNSLASISKALNSEDSETSHYAASVLQDSLNGFRAMVQNSYNEILEEKENQLVHVRLLIEYMNPVLAQRVFTDMEQKSMVHRMSDVCQILYEKEPDRMSGEYFEDISLRLLEIKDYEACKMWCDRAAKYFPKRLSTYTCQLKLYFSCGDRDSFFRVLDELKQSDVVIDNETLELIRVFQT